MLYSYLKKKLSLSIVNEPKGTLSIVIMNDNAPAKVVTVWPWHYMINLHSVLCKVGANSDNVLVLLEPRSSFRCQYRLLTMTTFFEIAVSYCW